MVLGGCWASICIYRCTWDNDLIRHSRMPGDGFHSLSLLSEAGICSPDTVSDDDVSLPSEGGMVQHISQMNSRGQTSLTSASRFHSFLTSKGWSLHCSPMIFEISGFARPGFWATT